MKRTEHNLQAAFIEWTEWSTGTMPELSATYAIINEGKRGRRQNPNTGRWYSTEGAKFVRQGMKKGMPDVCIPAPRGDYGALYIEFKKPGEKSRPEQVEVQEKLRAAGNLVVEIDNLDDAIKTTTVYLKGGFVRPSMNGECSSSHILTHSVKS